MQQTIYNQVNSFNQAVAYEATKKFTGINARAYEKLLKRQFALASLCLEGSVKQLELTKGVKVLNNFAASQSDISRQCGEKAYKVARETIDILIETRAEFDTWAQEGLSKFIPSTLK
jgi:hypothetical protein